MSEKIKEYVPQNLKDEILRIINPKFADCTRKKFELIEASENKEEATKKVMFLIRKLIEKNFLTVKDVMAKKDLSLYPKSKIEKAINYAFSNSPLQVYLQENSKDKLRDLNRKSKFYYGTAMAKALFGEKKQEGITLTNKILGHLKTNTEFINRFPQKNLN